MPTVVELRKLASQHNISHRSKLNKSELLNELQKKGVVFSTSDKKIKTQSGKKDPCSDSKLCQKILKASQKLCGLISSQKKSPSMIKRKPARERFMTKHVFKSQKDVDGFCKKIRTARFLGKDEPELLQKHNFRSISTALRTCQKVFMRKFRAPPPPPPKPRRVNKKRPLPLKSDSSVLPPEQQKVLKTPAPKKRIAPTLVGPPATVVGNIPKKPIAPTLSPKRVGQDFFNPHRGMTEIFNKYEQKYANGKYTIDELENQIHEALDNRQYTTVIKLLKRFPSNLLPLLISDIKKRHKKEKFKGPGVEELMKSIKSLENDDEDEDDDDDDDDNDDEDDEEDDDITEDDIFEDDDQEDIDRALLRA